MSEIYSAPPKSRCELRVFAQEIRKFLGLENEIYIPIVKLLDALTLKLGGKFDYVVVEDYELPESVHAISEFTDRCIVKIKQSVYEGAALGNGRDRMTIAHEISHYFLVEIFGVVLAQTKGNRQVKPYESPEWQAKCLAGELMMDKTLVGDLSVYAMAMKCGVSEQAAAFQYKIFHREV